MNLFKKGIGAFLLIGLIVSCGDDGVTIPTGEVITGVDFTVVPNADGDGTVVTLTPVGTGATSFEVDFGDGSAIATVAAGNVLEHDYPNPTGTAIADQTSEYLIILTAKGDNLADVPRPLNVEVTYDLDGDGVFAGDECPRFAAGGSPDGDRTGCPTIASVAGIVSARADSDVISIFSDGVANPNFNSLGHEDFGVGYLGYSYSVSEADYFANAGEDAKFKLDAVPVVIGDLDDGDILDRNVERDNNVLQYAFLDSASIAFGAVDLTAANSDVPSLTNLHLQVYSTEIDGLLITLIDSESEEEFEFDDQAVANGAWTAIDIALPAGLVDGSIDQIQIEVGGSSSATGSKSLYVDNVYLYK